MSTGKDKFGLPKLSTNQEVIMSFTLFSAGFILTTSLIITAGDMIHTPTGLAGLLMILTSYFFALEVIRELEEKEHVLSEYLEIE